MSQELSDKIRAAAQAKGIDPDVALAIAKAESSLRPGAEARTSSAAGLFQVIDETWKQFGGNPKKKLDPDENIRVGTDIIASNTEYLRKALQRDPRPAEIYAAHYFGPTGAKSFLSADPTTPISNILSKKQVAANPNLQGKTAAQVLAQLEGKMGANVSRETKPVVSSPVKEREPLPASLPPMAQADIKAPSVKPEAAAKVASLGPGYQAALALSFLADTDEEKDRETTITQEFMAKAQEEEDDRATAAAISARQANVFADLSNTRIRSPFPEPQQPVRMAEGGDVSAEQERLTPQQIERIAAQGPTERKDETFFDAASRTYVDVLTGRREPITAKDFTAKEQMAMMDAVRRSQARGGKGRVDYEDYPDSNTVGPGYVDIRNTLGGFQYKQMPDGSTVITDKYDFHGPRVAEYEKMGGGEKLVKSAKNALIELVKSGGGVRDLAGELGRAYVGSKGPEVNIRIPVNRADGSPPTGERKLDRETITLMRGEGMQPAAMQRVKPPLELNPSAAGLPGLMMYNDPSLPGTGTAGYVMMGDDSGKNPAMAQAMFLNSKDGNKADTIAHETEHLLARQNLGRGSNINTKFDELIGDQNGLKRIQFVQKAVEAGPYLKEKYGLESAYFKPEMVEFQGRRAKNLLYEQLASLSALEQRHKVDLTKDPELRKTLFARPDVRETYNALTGLRQTRLDPRDLPPHTRVREPGMLDAIKGVFKRAEGGPVYRADGSSEEGERLTPQQIERIAAQEAAEREAASTAAFIAQKSGIGRKAGPVSQALQSGQGYIEAAKGFTMLPQNLVGAAFDLSNMVAGLYGGNVDKPIFGSENLKEQSRKAGLAFKPSDDPTLAAFYGAGDLGSNLVNPAGLTRAGVQAAGKTGEAAKMLARDFQQYNQNLAVPGVSYAVRNKGTPVAMTGLPFLPNVNEAEKVVKAVTIGQRKEPLDVTDKSLSDWFSKTVTRYLRSDFASPQDQLVRAAEEGKALHLAPKEFSDSAEDQALKHFLGRRQSDLEYMRQAEGFGKSNMATTPYGQRIEDIIDISAYPERVGDLTPNRVPPSMRNIVDTQPETRVTDFAPNIVENLKLEALRDKMLDVRQSDGKYGAYGQPAAKIPAEFLLPDDTLAKLNVAAASNRMARYTNWQNETRQKMATTALRADPAFPRAQLQEGKFIGVALPDIKKNPEAKQLVIDVGCDGGWCTRYTPNAEAYASGFNRLHVIVTGEGKQARPVAQFSVADSGVNFDSGRRFSILEIKEKGNTADFANNPALPAIQQYIQHLDKTYGGLDYVDDLKGLRMTQLPEYPNQVLNFFDPPFTQKMDLGQKFGNVENGLRAVRDKAVDLNNGSRFVVGNDTDMSKMLEEATNLLVPTKRSMTLEEIKANIQKKINLSKATGGMIERQADNNRRYL